MSGIMGAMAAQGGSSSADRLPLALWAVIAAGAALRLAGLCYGLPAVFNSDEPHLVNLAVSFGRGSLRPDVLKYPTLFPYLLFACYGAFFLLWSGFGLARKVAEFGRFFAWNPTPFYVIGRSLSAAASLVALLPVYRAGRTWLGETGAVFAAGLLAVSPTVVTAAHAVKPETLMFCCGAFAWWFSARYVAEGKARNLVLAGVAAGLSLSSQYTAAPLGSVLISAWAARRLSEGRGQVLDLVKACLAAGIAFLAGSPYIALDFARFRDMVLGLRELETAAGGGVGVLVVLRNVMGFGGPWVGGLAFLAGAAVLLKKDRPRALWLLLPVLAYVVALARSPEGHWERYMMALYPALALTAGCGFEAAAGALPRPWTLVAAAALMIPGAWGSLAFDRGILTPDTRTLAARWIEENVPRGKTVLLDQEHASPRLSMTKAEVERLLAKTAELGHPRERYYRYLLEGHPGGGYELYRVRRDFSDLHSYPAHVAFSQAGHPVLDVRSGLDAALAAGVEFVVLTSWGADTERSPELAPFLAQVRRDGRLLQAFEPAPGALVGPRLEIYAVK